MLHISWRLAYSNLQLSLILNQGHLHWYQSSFHSLKIISLISFQIYEGMTLDDGIYYACQQKAFFYNAVLVMLTIPFITLLFKKMSFMLIYQGWQNTEQHQYNDKLLFYAWLPWWDNALTQKYAGLCIIGSIPRRDGQICAVYMLLCALPSFAALPRALTFAGGELAVRRVFPTVAIRMYKSLPLHWFHWTAVWLQLQVSLVHVSACSFAMSSLREF